MKYLSILIVLFLFSCSQANESTQKKVEKIIPFSNNKIDINDFSKYVDSTKIESEIIYSSENSTYKTVYLGETIILSRQFHVLTRFSKLKMANG